MREESEKTSTSEDVERGRLLEELVSKHETELLRYATRILRNPAAAQDVVQNAFIKLFRGFEKGTRPTDKVRGWLFRVTHNEAIDFIRRETRFRNMQLTLKEDFENDDHEAKQRTQERKTAVLEHLDRLADHEKQVIILRLEEGMSYKEISEITGRSVGNVGNILHHAVKKLGEELKRSGLVPAAPNTTTGNRKRGSEARSEVR